MKNLTWQNPEQLFVAQELINKVKSKCCGIKAKYIAKLLIDAGVQKEKLQGVSHGGIDIYKPYTANRHTCVILSKDNSSLENK